MLAQTIQSRIKYVYHYDELTWIPGVLSRPFNRMNIPYQKRELFLDWLDKYSTGMVYIWPGLVSPSPGASGWGYMVAPDEKATFLIFESDSDQTRFALEFVGNPVGMSAVTYRDGFEAYHNIKR